MGAHVETWWWENLKIIANNYYCFLHMSSYWEYLFLLIRPNIIALKDWYAIKKELTHFSETTFIPLGKRHLEACGWLNGRDK